MIFSPPLARAVARGRKTQTRRVVRRPPRSPWIQRRDGSRRRRPDPMTVLLDGELFLACRYQPGGTYSVQPGRGKSCITVGTQPVMITVASVRRERVGQVTYDDARAEGFRTTAEFKAYWVRLHEPALFTNVGTDHGLGLVDAEGTVDVVECVEPSEEMLVERFEQRHADTMVWVISFELARDLPRLLTPAARNERDGDEHGYTHDPRRALPDAAETLDEAVLHEYALDAAERWAGQPGRREEALRRRASTLGTRLRKAVIAQDRAEIQSIIGDLGHLVGELAHVDQHLSVLERQRKAAA